MQKIPTLFVRDPETKLRYVLNEIHPQCKWVLDGEGVATRKYDGTCCLVRGGRLFKRHEVKPGKTAPPNFEAIETDENTGKTVGWVPIDPPAPEDRWHREGYDDYEKVTGHPVPDGTYELCGPKVQGNPEDFDEHTLIPHGKLDMNSYTPRDFDGLRDFLANADFEGIVWHHPDGRMAKLKRRDFPNDRRLPGDA